MDSQLRTEVETAEELGVSKWTLARWRSRGKGGPAYVRIGERRIAYRKEDIELYLLQRRVEQ